MPLPHSWVTEQCIEDGATVAAEANKLFEMRLALWNHSFFSETFVILVHCGNDGHQKTISPIDLSLTIHPFVSYSYRVEFGMSHPHKVVT